MNTPIHQMFRFSLDDRLPNPRRDVYRRVYLWIEHREYMALQAEIAEMVKNEL